MGPRDNEPDCYCSMKNQGLPSSVKTTDDDSEANIKLCKDLFNQKE